MQIPQGFQFDTGTGLYFREELVQDSTSGQIQRKVTWFNPQDQTFQDVLYPFDGGQNAPVMVNMQNEPSSPVKKRKTGCIIAVVIFAVLALVGVVLAVLLSLGLIAGAGILSTMEDIPLDSVQEEIAAIEDGLEAWEEQQDSQEHDTSTPNEPPPQSTSVLGTYFYELTGPGLFVYFHFDTPTPGLVMIDMDFGGSTYTIEADYFVEGDTLTITTDNGFDAIGWNGLSVFAIGDNTLTLLSDTPFGIVEPGAVLHADGESPQSTDDTITFMCMDPDIPNEYRPYIEFYSDDTFHMFINMGEGVYDGYGQYIVEDNTSNITLHFTEINGTPPGENYTTAHLQLLDSNTLYFETEGFGLMGYGENTGIFTLQEA